MVLVKIMITFGDKSLQLLVAQEYRECVMDDTYKAYFYFFASLQILVKFEVLKIWFQYLLLDLVMSFCISYIFLDDSVLPILVRSS